MKKLKARKISHYSKVLLFTLVILTCYKCENSSVSEKSKKQDGLTKGGFYKCLQFKDTVFSNGNYLKYIPVDSRNYTIEIKMDNITDTLDFYLSCETQSGMVPKLLSGPDFICFTQGSSSYRYLTLCSLSKEGNKIITEKFETVRDVSSTRDGFLFRYENSLFFYDIVNEKLLSKKVTNRLLSIKHSELFNKDMVLIENDLGDDLTYNLRAFH